MNRPGIGHSAQQVFANAPGAAVGGRVAGDGQCAGVADKVALWKQILRFRDARNAAGTGAPVTQEPAGQAPSRGTWAAVFAQLTGAARSEQVAQRSTDAILFGRPGSRRLAVQRGRAGQTFGVALVTARDGLGAVREAGLVETRRGREGGSFVLATEHTPERLLRARLRGLSQVEIADLAVYFGAGRRLRRTRGRAGVHR